MAGLSPTGVHRELLYSAGRAGVLASGGRLVAADLVKFAVDKGGLDNITVVLIPVPLAAQ